jgi:hypothetical protein
MVVVLERLAELGKGPDIEDRENGTRRAFGFFSRNFPQLKRIAAVKRPEQPRLQGISPAEAASQFGFDAHAISRFLSSDGQWQLSCTPELDKNGQPLPDQFHVTIRDSGSNAQFLYHKLDLQIDSCALSPTAGHIAFATADGAGGSRIYLFDTQAKVHIGSVSVTPTVEIVDFTPDEQLVVASTGSALQMYETAGGALKESYDFTGRVHSFSFDSASRLLAVGTDTSATLIDMSNDERRDLPHRGAVESIYFSHDGALVATGGQDGVARVWRLSDLQQATAPVPTAGNLQSVAFSRIGEMLLTFDDRGTIRGWTGTHPPKMNLSRPGPARRHLDRTSF